MLWSFEAYQESSEEIELKETKDGDEEGVKADSPEGAAAVANLGKEGSIMVRLAMHVCMIYTIAWYIGLKQERIRTRLCTQNSSYRFYKS